MRVQIIEVSVYINSSLILSTSSLRVHHVSLICYLFIEWSMRQQIRA